MIENSSFLFIPDISGFTNFVKQMEISHSQHIIAELLELLIDANELDLTLAEIEGDALFFYKFENIPSRAEVLKQVKKMYTEFHNHLKLYETRRICQCGACSSAVNLSLKFVAHSGLFQLMNVKEQQKPFGEDVIVIHRLLKNDIHEKEYLLLTNQLLQKMDPSNLNLEEEWPAFRAGDTQYEKIGTIKYQYSRLTALRKYVSTPPSINIPALSAKPLVFQAKIRASKKSVFELISNFNFRRIWNKKVDQFQYEKNRVNRLGTKHICVIGKNQLEFETVTNNFGPDRLIYGERTTQIPLVKEASTYFIIEANATGTNLRIEVHYKTIPLIGYFLTPFFKKLISKLMREELRLIKQNAEENQASEGIFKPV